MSNERFKEVAEEVFQDDALLLAALREPKSVLDSEKFLQTWSSLLAIKEPELRRLLEVALRQLLFFQLIPAEGFDLNYKGSLDVAIKKHFDALHIPLSKELTKALVAICTNVRKDLATKANEKLSVRDLKAQIQYDAIRNRQKHRCFWCGVELDHSAVRECLDHYIPAALGNDPPSARNWVLSCSTCNVGKADIVCWSASGAAFSTVSRPDMAMPHRIGQAQRWIALARDRKCEFCPADTTSAELHITRRVYSGLVVPLNCRVACQPCAKEFELPIIDVNWHERESERAQR